MSIIKMYPDELKSYENCTEQDKMARMILSTEDYPGLLIDYSFSITEDGLVNLSYETESPLSEDFKDLGTYESSANAMDCADKHYKLEYEKFQTTANQYT